MKYLFVIPARGGSKGIPDKNIIDIGGKPLIAYSIEVAKEALTARDNAGNRLIDGEMAVSTDSGQIADIARRWGGNVPFMRPAGISGDKAKSVEFMLHALNFYAGKGRSFDATVLLQPTSPLRSVQDVLQAVQLYEKTGQPSLISGYREEYICDLVCYRLNGDTAQPLNHLHNAGITRQEHDRLYVRNGAIYITDTEYLRRGNKLICDTPAMYVMPKSRSVNLDTAEDVEILRWHLR